MKAGRLPVAAALLIISAVLLQRATAEDIYWEGEEDASNEFLEVQEDERAGLAGMLHRVRRDLWDLFNPFSSTTTPPPEPTPAALTDEHVDEENALDRIEEDHNFGSGAAPPERDPEQREKTLRVSFVVMEPYEAQYSNRDSVQFQNFSRSLADAVNLQFESLPGNQRATLVRIQSRLSDNFSCKVTLDILTSGYEDTTRIAQMLRDHIRDRRTLGSITVSDADFSATVIDPGAVLAECAGDELRCDDGHCVPLDFRCNGQRDCPDGTDEEGCPLDNHSWESQTDVSIEAPLGTPPPPRGTGVFIIDENTELENDPKTTLRPCNAFDNDQSDCQPIVDEDDQSVDNNQDKYDNNNQLGSSTEVCLPDELRCDGTNCVSLTSHCDGVQDCQDGTDELGCEPCEHDDFRCDSGKCIAKQRRCDNVQDCSQGEDEFNCECSKYEFRCKSDGSCIEARKQCDGTNHCRDGSDEADCVGRSSRMFYWSGAHVCRDGGRFRCGDGTCVSTLLRCDGYVDCPRDSTDETGCPCNPDQWQCDHGSCIRRTKRCDGRVDCPSDRSDERNCHATGYFRCRTGKYIPERLRCNRQYDCPNGDYSDEKNCPCSADDFKCNNGHCIPASQRCDRTHDCQDGSDETNCIYAQTLCMASEYKCSNGNCVKADARCNGTLECLDGSDEMDCPCKRDEFHCREGTCINIARLCNGFKDCPYGDDEFNCDKCRKKFWQCGDGTCIKERKVCDGRADCADRSDEALCQSEPKLLRKASCPSNRFTCEDGACATRCNNDTECSGGEDEANCFTAECNHFCDGSCLDDALICNDEEDCSDASDELNCEKCDHPDEFRCRDGECIGAAQRCNNITECKDSSDEWNCDSIIPQPQGCKANEFQCNNGLCIDLSFQCDKHRDCTDNSDEEDCSWPQPRPAALCADADFTCDDGSCIPHLRRCDNFYDCLDFSDEQNCHNSACSEDEWKCANGECISSTSYCDGHPDCRDSSDETSCFAPGTVPPNYYPEYPTTTSRPLRTSSRPQYPTTSSPYRPYEPARGDTTTCDEDQWQCNNGDCISTTSYCDGHPDCRDSSDEISCSTPGPVPPNYPYPEYPTTTSRPLRPTSRPQYPTTSSPYRPYEPSRGQSNDGCNNNDWRCENGPCIDKRLRCDGHVDCPQDESDELDCPPGSPPALNLRPYPEKQTVHYGGDVVFQCRDEGPERAKVAWSREGGRPLKPGSVDSKGRLEINSVTLADSGVYICHPKEAKFQGGMGSEMRVTLHVAVERKQITNTPFQQTPCTAYEATCGDGQCISKSLVCDGKVDCTDQSDEEACNYNGVCEPNQFQCRNRKCVLKTWLCDSENDCGDGSDEANCGSAEPGQDCLPIEFTCQSGQQCVPKSFHCDGQPDCLDRSDEIGCDRAYISKPPTPQNVKLNPGDTLRLTCEAVGVPTPLINWRLNWGHVPDKCTSTSVNGRGDLVCPDMAPENSGAYSCEAINIKGTNFAVPDAIVSVNRSDICRPGYFNSEANSASECIRCFCFGESTQCQSADLYTYNMPTPLGQGGTRLLGVQVDGRGDVQIDSQPITDLYYYAPLRNGAEVTKLETFASRNAHPYVALPETYNGNQLTSYGGFIKYRLQPQSSRYNYDTNVPDIIIKGKYGNLVYYHRHNNNDRATNLEVRLVPGNWQKGSAQATREDIMMALDNVELILLRADLNGAGVKITDFFMESAQHLNAGLGAATLVEECSCPPGYEGLSCQKCASGYAREGSGPWLGNCVAEEKPCPPGTYGSPRSGIGCQPCPCPLTNRENQFARTCSLAYNGRVICDCLSGYEGDNCEKCAPGFVGNPSIPGDSCQPRQEENNCNPIGTSQVRLPDSCICKDHVRGRYCDQCNADSFFLSEDFRHGCAQCFCSGVTQKCSSSSLRRQTTTVMFNVPQIVREVKVYNSTPVGPVGTLRYNTPVETDLQPSFYRGEISLENVDGSRPTIYYWSLPISFSGDKVTSYGGYLRYALRHVPISSSQRNNAADVQLISENGPTFHYFGNFEPSSDGYVNASVQFLEKGWLRPDGKEVQRENLLLSLADVKTILIKATYSNNVQASLVSASIETAEPSGNGPQAMHVEQCVCPSGYQGTSCEDCAAGFTRSGRGLYLEHCGPCECNGHSEMCHPETGVCYECKHDTAGERCEECRPGYEKDRRGNCVQAYNPYPDPNPTCNCDPRGELRCDFGRCVCKVNVEGDSCDVCRPGTFGLDRSNPLGCLPCYCSGVTNECYEAAHYTRIPIPAPIFGETYGGYNLQDLNAEQVINDQFVPAANESELTYVFTNPPTEELYWSLPVFPGNRILSYGGHLTLTQKFETAYPGENSQSNGVDVVLDGADTLLYWTNPQEFRSGQSFTYKIPLRENDWNVFDTGASASRNEFLRVLADLKRVLIRATLAQSTDSTAIADVSLTTASDRYQGQIANGVEVCKCPEGYTGTSCESCSPGYFKDNRGKCRQCKCNGHECQAGPYGDVICNCQPPFTGPDCLSIGLVMELHPTVHDNYTSDSPLRTLTVTCKYRAPEPLTIQFYYEGKEINPPQYLSESWLEMDGWHGEHHWSTVWDGRHKGLVIECHTITALGSTLGMLTSSLPEPLPASELSTSNFTTRPPPPQSTVVVTITSPTIKIQELGRSVNFTCQAHSQMVRRPLEVTWSKEDGELPRSRTTVDSRAGLLLITQVQASDSGIYVCQANDGVSIAQATVTLKVPGNKMTTPTLTINPTYNDYVEGDRIELECIVHGNPTPRITWQRANNRPLPITVQSSESFLVIERATVEDAGEYRCTASNVAGSNDRTAVITVRPRPSRPSRDKLTINPTEVNINEGQSTSVVCTGTTKVPPGSIRWMRQDGTELISNVRSSTGVLYIQVAQIENQGVYVCQTSSPDIAPVKVLVSVQPLYTQPPGSAPSVSVREEHVKIPTGESGVFECIPSGYPTPLIRWTKHNSQLGSGTSQRDNSLVISNAQEEDKGYYLCEGSVNGERVAYAYMEVNIERREPPSIEISPQGEQAVPLGSQFEFHCRVTGFPVPDVTWNRDGGRPLPQHVHILMSNQILKFDKVEINDDGIYTCSATNVVGTKSSSAVLKVRSPPEIRISQSYVTVVRGDPVNVECRASGFPDPMVSLYKVEESENRRELGAPNPGIAVLSISAAGYQDDGQYSCIATSAAGNVEERFQVLVEDRNDNGNFEQIEGSGEEKEPEYVQNQTNDDQQVLIAVEGKDAVLTCKNSANYAVRWSKANFQPLQRNAVQNGNELRISSASQSDSGYYECSQLDPVTNEVHMVSYMLKVMGTPIISLRPLKQIVNPGESPRVECIVDGPGITEISWKPVNKPFSSRVQVRENVLIFHEIEVEDAGEYECFASNLVASATNRAAVIVNEELSRLAESHENEQWAHVGAAVHLSCNVSQANIRISWTKDGAPVPRSVHQKQDGSLFIKHAQKIDSGHYVCILQDVYDRTTKNYIDLHIEGSRGENRPQYNDVKLVNIDQPRTPFTVGQNVEVLCRSRSRDIKVKWERAGNNQFVETRTYGDGAQLLIRNVVESDAGVYRCLGQDKYGHSTYDDLNLVIVPGPGGPSYPSTGDKQPVYTARLDGSVSLPCSHDLSPPVSVEWRREYVPLSSDLRTNEATLNLGRVTEADAGTYICRVSNSQQAVESRATLRVIGVVPRFDGDGWLALPTLKDAYRQFEIEISLKPSAPDGLIFYNSENFGQSGDYVALQLVNGIPRFILETGYGPPLTVEGDRPLQLNTWHTIRLNWIKLQVTMDVDNNSGPFIQELPAGVTYILDLKQPLYIGGVPDNRQLPPELDGAPGFIGCVSMLVVGQEEMDIMVQSRERYQIKDCDTCSPNLCQNKGVCQEARNEHGYTCLCAAGFAGADCSRTGQACRPGTCGPGKCADTADGFKCSCPVSFTGKRCENQQQIEYPAFTGSAFLAIKPEKMTRTFKMVLKIKPTYPVMDGIIMYYAESARGLGGFTSLAVRDGKIEFRYDVADGKGPVILTSSRKVPAEEWTQVSFSRIGTKLQMKINEVEFIHGNVTTPKKTLNLDTMLYVGGYDDSIVLNNNTGVTGGFSGCIKDVSVFQNNIDIVNSSIRSANVQECTSDRDSRGDISVTDSVCSQCINGGYCATANAVSCTCRPGYTGEYCEQRVQLDPCAVAPCRNGGTCRPDPHNRANFSCDCPLGYTGAHCQMRLELLQSVGFNGNGYMELPATLLRYDFAGNEPAVIALAVLTSHDGVLLYQREAQARRGHGDYILLRVDAGKVLLEWDIGGGPTTLVADEVTVTDGEYHRIIAKMHSNRTLSLEVDGYSRAGTSAGFSDVMNADSNIYIGGIPDALNLNGYPGLTGCFDQVELMASNRGLTLGSLAVAARNTQRCRDAWSK